MKKLITLFTIFSAVLVLALSGCKEKSAKTEGFSSSDSVGINKSTEETDSKVEQTAEESDSKTEQESEETPEEFIGRQLKARRDSEVSGIYKVSDDFYIVFEKKESEDISAWNWAYCSDGKSYFGDVHINTMANKAQKDYSDHPEFVSQLGEERKIKAGGIEYDGYIADFNFDEKPDILYFWLCGMGPGISIRELPLKEIREDMYRREKESPEKFEMMVATFKDVKFLFGTLCGIRGFYLYDFSNNYIEVAGGPDWKSDKTESGNQYFYTFYGWNKENHKYEPLDTFYDIDFPGVKILDDYFDYSGLKFSKLDSKLQEEDLAGLNKNQLRLMRNAVYARHGRTFKSEDLQSLWNCYEWYEPNPAYSDELLTETDKYNIDLIQKLEEKK